MIEKLSQFRSFVHRCAGAIRWLPPVLARVTLGVVFIESGYGKLTHLDKVISFFTDLGIPAPALQAPFVAATEFFCGLLVLIGLGTRVASVPLAFTMIVAIATAKRAELNGVSELFGFSEFLYIALFAYLFTEGAGKLSLDYFLGKKYFSGTGSPTRLARAA